MARPKLAIPSVEKNISLPEDLAAAVDLELFSEVEGKVPFGAWKGFITRVIRQHLERQGRARMIAGALTAIADHEVDTPQAIEDKLERLLLQELTLLGYHEAVTVFHKARFKTGE